MRASRALVLFLVLSLLVVIFFAKGRRPATPLPTGKLLPATPPALLVLASNVSPSPAAPTTLPTTQPSTQPMVAVAPTTRPIAYEPAPEVIITGPLGEARSKLAA